MVLIRSLVGGLLRLPVVLHLIRAEEDAALEERGRLRDQHALERFRGLGRLPILYDESV